MVTEFSIKVSRTEFLNQLRNPKESDDASLAYLREHVLVSRDQRIQIAAMRGVEKIGGNQAVKIFAERVINYWGMSAIGRAIKGLERLADDGGLFCLSATLFLDPRYFWEKIGVVSKKALDLGYKDTSVALQSISLFTRNIFLVRDIAINVLQTLEESPFDDLKYGAMFARLSMLSVQWAGTATIPSEQDYSDAKRYAEMRVPGVSNVILSSLPNASIYSNKLLY